MLNKAISAALLATVAAVPVTTPAGSVGANASIALTVATFDSTGVKLPVLNLNIPYQGILWSGISQLTLPTLPKVGLPKVPVVVPQNPSNGTGVGSFPKINIPTIPTLKMPTLPAASVNYPGSPYAGFDLKGISVACAAKGTVLAPGAPKPCVVDIKGFTDDAGKTLAAEQKIIFNAIPSASVNGSATTGNTIPMVAATLSNAFTNLRKVTFAITNTAGQAVADVGMIDGVSYTLNPKVSGTTPKVP